MRVEKERKGRDEGRSVEWFLRRGKKRKNEQNRRILKGGFQSFHHSRRIPIRAGGVVSVPSINGLPNPSRIVPLPPLLSSPLQQERQRRDQRETHIRTFLRVNTIHINFGAPNLLNITPTLQMKIITKICSVLIYSPSQSIRAHPKRKKGRER